MMVRFVALILFLTLLPFKAKAELDIDISEPTLKISTGFDGDTLTLFGTSKPKGDIVIIVKGPAKNTTVRRITDVIGLWINARSITFNDIPQYYNVASSRSIFDIADAQTRIDNRIGINSLIFTTSDDISNERHGRFQEALIQNMQLADLYSLTPDAVEYINDTLFKTRIHMPSNVPVGDYEIEAFLFQNGKMIDRQSRPFHVQQFGLTASVHDFAISQPFLYGVIIIMIAIFSSLVAILLLRRE
jgi:uncharacterized protein (TIGR02186 family)